MTALAARSDDPAAVALTRRERDIARTATDGMTDRDIAAAPVVSVRTVESHLGVAYLRLGIRSRRDLVTALPPGGGGAYGPDRPEGAR